jgi:hypothetical protein
MISIYERAVRYLSHCEGAISGSGGHDTTFKIAMALVQGFCLPAGTAHQLLRNIYNPKCSPPWSNAELRHKVASAANAQPIKPRGWLLNQDEISPSDAESFSPLDAESIVLEKQHNWPVSKLDEVDQIVRTGPRAYDLWEDSPCRFDDDASHAEEVVEVVFPGDPLLCAGWTAWHFETRRRNAWRGLLAKMPLMVPNPMVAPSGLTKAGKGSQHTLSATANRIYLVVEFDFREKDQRGRPTIWTPVVQGWHQNDISLLDACAALSAHLAKRLPGWLLFLSSGGKSGHSWFNSAGLSISGQRAFFDQAVRLGADPQLWLRSQFVRIPDGRRDNGNRQSILHFNPQHAISLCPR